MVEWISKGVQFGQNENRKEFRNNCKCEKNYEDEKYIDIATDDVSGWNADDIGTKYEGLA